MSAKKSFTKAVLGAVVFIAGLATTAYKLFSESEPSQYSPQWFERLSDDELNAEREIVRQQSCTASDGDSFERLQNLLYEFDNEIRSRKPAPSEDAHYPHREHGWYLPNDE